MLRAAPRLPEWRQSAATAHPYMEPQPAMNARAHVDPLGPSAAPRSAGESRPAGAGERARLVRFDDAEPAWLGPLLQADLLVPIGTLFAALLAFGEPLTVHYAALAVLAVVAYNRCVTPPPVRRALMYGTTPIYLSIRFLVEWGAVVGVLLLVGFALKTTQVYSRAALSTWFVVTPLALVGVYHLQFRVARALNERGALATRYVILGANAVGAELARRLNPRSFCGWFDFRSPDRAQREQGVQCRPAAELADRVREQGVAAVYVALPIANSPRIKSLLAELRDTTASVYFVPDIVTFDLLQARIVDVNGMPAIAVRDTPLRGGHALSKRVADLAIAGGALAVLWPLMIAIAIAIKCDSRGSVFFRQRRYGLEGDEIRVWKFRTMTVCEDGGQVVQARGDDIRITRVGRVLRRTSLDELPQLLNVLRGEMSVVGPRPHAVAHNEQYRRLISGYMLRHKVRPGITGWAQVHGLRGETDTLGKMEQRVHYDLDYLANWSPLLDLRILVRTVRIVLRGENAH
jgi:putative colanic acid biosynthesis UDP-glucose lipid carrier transferase